MNRCSRCDFVGDLAEHAPQAGHWLCDCSRSLTEQEPRTCELCLTDFRRTLADILALWQELPHHLRTVSGSALGGARRGDDGPPLPGGVVLALLGPGSQGGSPRRLTQSDKKRIEAGEPRWWIQHGQGPLTPAGYALSVQQFTGLEHAVDNREDDHRSVAWVLGNLEDDWRHTRGDDPAMSGTSTSSIIQGAGRYLEVHARWAANHHEAFAECYEELRNLRALLEAATHRLRRPAKANADCFACGGDLIRRVVDGLEEDAVTCRDCREQYDPARYGLALKAAAEAASAYVIDGETWATPAVLAAELERSEHTIRSWAQRDRIRHHTRAGVLFVSAEDARARHEETPKRKTA